MATFPERFMELRRERGWSQKAVAERLKIDRTTVGKWESAGTVPALDVLESLAQLFGVSIDYLTGRTDVRTVELPDDVLTIALHRSADDLPDEAKRELIRYAEYLRQRFPLEEEE